jgi:hypothetical protein
MNPADTAPSTLFGAKLDEVTTWRTLYGRRGEQLVRAWCSRLVSWIREQGEVSSERVGLYFRQRTPIETYKVSRVFMSRYCAARAWTLLVHATRWGHGPLERVGKAPIGRGYVYRAKGS